MHFLVVDGQILPTSRRQEVSANGTLVLHRVDSSTDRGAYTCTAKNKQGRSDSQTIHIEVKGKVISLLHADSLSPPFFRPQFYTLKLEQQCPAKMCACVLNVVRSRG